MKPDGSLRSGIYTGRVVHRRYHPVEHDFAYRVVMVGVDVDEFDELCALHPLWSSGRRNVVSLNRADYFGDPGIPLAEAVRNRVEEVTGVRPGGSILLLTQPRTWGWLFNPISIYYCLTPDHEVEFVLVEVTNTPWHERTTYVLPGIGEHVRAKELHVSPFLPMDLEHHFTLGRPGRHLTVGIDDLRGGTLFFRATMALQRHEASRASLQRLITNFPFMTIRVSWAIYRQALALRWKGARFHPHPNKSAETGKLSVPPALKDEPPEAPGNTRRSA